MFINKNPLRVLCKCYIPPHGLKKVVPVPTFQHNFGGRLFNTICKTQGFSIPKHFDKIGGMRGFCCYPFVFVLVFRLILFFVASIIEILSSSRRLEKPLHLKLELQEFPMPLLHALR